MPPDSDRSARVYLRAATGASVLLVVYAVVLLAAPDVGFSGLPVAIVAAVAAGTVAFVGFRRTERPARWLLAAAALLVQGGLLSAHPSGNALFSYPWSMIYFVSLAVLALAAWSFVKPSSLRDVTSLLDTSIVATATALVLYEFLLRPVVDDLLSEDLAVAQLVTAFGTVGLDLFFAAGLVWLFASLPRQDRSGRLVYVALAAAFLANVALQVSTIGDAPSQTASVAAWALWPVLLLVSATMLTFAVFAPASAPPDGAVLDAELSTWRLVLVAGLTAVVPVAALVPYAFREQAVAAPAIPVAFTFVLWMLLMVRVVRLLRGFRASLRINELVQNETVTLLAGSSLHAPPLDADDAADAARGRLVAELPSEPRAMSAARRALDAALATLSSVAQLSVERAVLQRQLVDIESLHRSRLLLEHTADVIVVVDPDLNVVLATPSSSELFSPPPPPGESLEDWFPPGVLAGACRSATVVSPVRLQADLSGAATPCDATVAVSVSWVPSEQVFVVTVHDVSELQDLTAQLRHAATHDPLTGLLNRTGLAQELEEAAAGGEFAVVLFDLDEFKQVNDLFGHQAGDALLVELAERLVGCLPAAAAAARLGGDEFAVVYRSGDPSAAAQQWAHEALQEFSQDYQLPGGVFTPHASAGVAVGLPDVDETFRRADVALYTAKAAGKHTVALFDDASAEQFRSMLQRMLLVQHDEVGDQLTVVYQPLVALAGAEGPHTVGFEALARWEHPTLGMVSPEVFLPLADRTDAMLVVTKSVITQALAQQQRWQEQCPDVPLPLVSVNVPPAQLSDDGFVAWLLRELEIRDLPAGSLVVELLESQLPPSPEALASSVRVLRRAGVRVFLDDFTTGFSSLDRLSLLPVDGVKIAREVLVAAAGPRVLPKVAELVAAAAPSAQVVVEGVETLEDVTLAASVPSVWLQGFFLSRPLPASQTCAFVTGDRLGKLPAGVTPDAVPR